MEELVKQLINYLDTTPKEVLEAEFKKLEPYCNIGPTAEEYIEYIERNNLRHKKSNSNSFLGG